MITGYWIAAFVMFAGWLALTPACILWLRHLGWQYDPYRTVLCWLSLATAQCMLGLAVRIVWVLACGDPASLK